MESCWGLSKPVMVIARIQEPTASTRSAKVRPLRDFLASDCGSVLRCFHHACGDRTVARAGTYGAIRTLRVRRGQLI